MAKWWMGVAVIVSGLVATAQAQNPYLPNLGRSALMPEPVPYSQAPLSGANPPVMPSGYLGAPLPAGVPAPNCVPGLPSSQETGNSLPGNMPNAWDQEPGYDPGAVYFSVGMMWMTRQRLGHTPAAVLDLASGGVDTGDLPPPNSIFGYANFGDTSPRANGGVRTTIGYHQDTHAFELSGFYLSQNNSAKTSANPGVLDAPFAAFNPPLGFEGDAGMWLQADIVRTSLKTAVGSGEATFRWWLGSDSSFSWGIGVRYLDIYERFGFYTGDDDLTVLDLAGNPDPTRQATYTVTAHNHLVAPQLGLEWSHEINCWLAFTVSAKGAWGVNFVDVDTFLQRGDGFVGFRGHRSDTIFSHLYEGGAYLNVRLMDNCRLRAGYNLIWAVDVAEATGQLDFNLSHHIGQTTNEGSIFYHGPSLELSILF